jgi:hypothetical protein
MESAADASAGYRPNSRATPVAATIATRAVEQAIEIAVVDRRSRIH